MHKFILGGAILISALTAHAETQFTCDNVAELAGGVMKDRLEGWSLSEAINSLEEKNPEILEEHPFIEEMLIQGYEMPGVDSARVIYDTNQGRELGDNLIQRFQDRWHVKCLRGNVDIGN